MGEIVGVRECAEEKVNPAWCLTLALNASAEPSCQISAHALPIT